MTEPTPLITAETKSVKVKDPKRVAAGKKLAEISKAAKERKMRERLAATDDGYDINYGYVIGVLGLVLSGITLWYTTSRKECVTKHVDVPQQQHIERKPVTKTLDTLE